MVVRKTKSKQMIGMQCDRSYVRSSVSPKYG